MKQTYLIISITAFFLAAALRSANAQQPTDYGVEDQAPGNYKDFRFAIGGGYAYRLGKDEKTGDAGLDNMSKELRHGFAIDAEAQYFFKDTWGLGLNANFCSANGSAGNVQFPDLDHAVNYKETQNIIYFGPSFVSRNETEKFLFISHIGFGPVFFNVDMNYSGQSITGNKATLGVNAGIAGEYRINNKTGLGLKLSYVTGSIDKINIENSNVEMENNISLSNLMVTLFLSFRTW